MRQTKIVHEWYGKLKYIFTMLSGDEKPGQINKHLQSALTYSNMSVPPPLAAFFVHISHYRSTISC